MNEKELIEACKNNDVRAQKLLYETFARKMMSVCLRYADNREMAEDFLQDGFIKVFFPYGVTVTKVLLKDGCGVFLSIRH